MINIKELIQINNKNDKYGKHFIYFPKIEMVNIIKKIWQIIVLLLSY